MILRNGEWLLAWAIQPETGEINPAYLCDKPDQAHRLAAEYARTHGGETPPVVRLHVRAEVFGEPVRNTAPVRGAQESRPPPPPTTRYALDEWLDAGNGRKRK